MRRVASTLRASVLSNVTATSVRATASQRGCGTLTRHKWTFLHEIARNQSIAGKNVICEGQRRVMVRKLHSKDAYGQPLKSDFTIMALAGVAVAGLASAVLLFQRSDDAPVSRKTLIAVYNELARRIQAALDEEKTTVAKLREIAHAREEEFDEGFARNLLKAHFARAVESAEKETFSKFKCSSKSISSAVQLHGDDPEVVKSVMEVQEILRQSPQAVEEDEKLDFVDVPDDFTEEKVKQVLEEMVQALSNAIDQVANEIEKEGGDISTQFFDRYTRRTEETLGQIRFKHKVSLEVLEAATRKYDSNPDFVQWMLALQAKQREEISSKLAHYKIKQG